MMAVFWIAFIAGLTDGLLIAILSNHGVPRWKRVIAGVAITAIAWFIVQGGNLC